MSDPTETKKSRRLAAIVFTDVVGYSARMQSDETGTLALVQADFERMRAACAAHGGQVLKSTGDGLLLCFDSVIDAVTCALEIQAGFSGRSEGALTHRIGIHLGDVYHQAGDVAGDGVNLAARLQTAAQPGTICVSDVVFAAVTGKVEMESAPLAPLVLKNIAKPMPATLIAPPGVRLKAGAKGRGVRNRRVMVLAAAAAAVLIIGALFFLVPWGMVGGSASGFPHDPALKRAQAMIYGIDGIAEDLVLADDIVKPLLAARPSDPEVVTVAAQISEEAITRGYDRTQARRAQAQKLTERAAQLAPDNPDALAVLGSYLAFTNTQLERAETLARDAIARNPKEARYHRLLFEILGRTKSPETEAFGAKMAALFPNDPLVAYDIATRYMIVQDLANAETWMDKAIALGPITDAIFWKANLRLQIHGDVAGMNAALEKVPPRQRTNARLVSALVMQALVTGNTARARPALDSIADSWLADGTYIFPKAMMIADLEDIDGHADIARLQYEAALKESRATQAADPTDLRPARAELWIQLGLGHREEALAALHVNLQLAPHPYHWNLRLVWWSSSLRAALLLGERAAALGQLKEACTEPMGRMILRNLFRFDPKMAPFRDDPEIAALLADAH